MTTRFEKLIEYVINDEQDKARELFHDIVVEKSRQIYEEMMDQEEMDEAKEEELDEDEEELDEAKEEDEEDLDEAKEEDLDEAMVDMGNDMGSAEGAVGEGDAADQMMQDVEAEESGMSEGEDEEEVDDFADETGFDDFEGDEDKSEDLEDRVVDLEDKLDELMAEFESLMGDEGGDMGDEEMDVIDVDSGEEDGMEDDMMEAVSLKAAPKPVTSEEGGINKKAVVAANSGAAGMEGKPVHTGGDGGGKHDTSAYSNSTKDLISDFQNKAGANMKDQKSAPKPVTSQASGVNTKSPLKGR